MNSTTQPRAGRGRIIGILIALVGMLALAWYAWHLTHPAADAGGRPGMGAPGGRGGRGGGGMRGGPPTTVGVATAARADLPVYLDALGTVLPAATATVRPQVSGVLQKLSFTEGQQVKAGQVLAVIDPRAFELTLQQASGQRLRDEAQLDSAKVTLERYRTLLAQDSIARQEVDTQAALVKQLQGTVAADRASEGQARLNLGYTQVRAPISGRVGLRQADVGNLVGPNDAGGVAVVTQMAPIDVQFAVPQDQVPALRARLRAGPAADATALDRARVNALGSGHFLALDNQVDTQTGTVRAKARFANADEQLFPSQFVNLRLQLDLIHDAVVVPVTALRHGADGDFVYVLDPAERTVALRPVQRGQADAERVAIVKGLQAGEQVITEGADRLKDGARVMLAGDKPAAGGPGGWGHGGRNRRGADGVPGAPGGAAAGGAHRWRGGMPPGGPGAPGDGAAGSGQRHWRGSAGEPAAGEAATPPAAVPGQGAGGAAGAGAAVATPGSAGAAPAAGRGISGHQGAAGAGAGTVPVAPGGPGGAGPGAGPHRWAGADGAAAGGPAQRWQQGQGGDGTDARHGGGAGAHPWAGRHRGDGGTGGAPAGAAAAAGTPPPGAHPWPGRRHGAAAADAAGTADASVPPAGAGR